MTWINTLWLLLGMGLGWSVHRQRREPLQDEQGLLQQARWDALLATEMSQFKAGFLARTSHELRSPLSGLIGMLQLILNGLCDDPAEEREFIEQAHESALRMVRILDTVIEVSKAEHGTANVEIQPLQLSKLLQEVYVQTHLIAQNRNLHLQLVSPDPDRYVLGDPRCVRQALVSLITQAISDLPEGSITLSVAPPTADAVLTHIWLDDPRPADRWQEAIAWLQTPCSDDPPVPSAGLHLLMAAALCQRLNGKLELLSIAPDRNRVQCSLPTLVPDATELV